MDQGAHFYKCDFQVHTPRDINWQGKKAVTEEERREYAEEFIQACRRKGLDAVAITDHHDFVFFPYIKRAAESELDDSGSPVPIEKRMVVFPGLELTLSTPACQTILILDASFPENLLSNVLAVLSITPSSPEDEHHASVTAIHQDVVNSIVGLYAKLNTLDYLKGRFIVFPNVTDGGHKTLLRSGFHPHYANMPCVGGYLDGPVTDIGTGNQTIFSGKNRDYGFKSIALFQTSDNRSRTFDKLGENATWVKWCEPTAEALRQACLAKESRLSHEQPEEPNYWVSDIHVSNSKFLSRVNLDFSRQYNAIIGGRGTGKSSILEYVRWGLCDQPTDEVEGGTVQAKRQKMIDNTLKEFKGETTVTLYVNEIRHIVKRNSVTQDISLKIGEAEFVKSTEQEIRNLLPIQAYSQKQLSNVGVRIEELKRFVELPIRQSLDKARSEIKEISSQLQVTYEKLVRKQELESENQKHKVEIESLTTQNAKLRDGLIGLSPEDQELIGRKVKIDNEAGEVEHLSHFIDGIREQTKELQSAFEVVHVRTPEPDTFNTEAVATVRASFDAKREELMGHIATALGSLEEESMTAFSDAVKAWETLRADFETKYESAKLRSAKNQTQLIEIQRIDLRIGELKKLVTKNDDTITELGRPENDYRSLAERWETAHKSKLGLIGVECEKFSALSFGLIVAKITGGIDTSRIKSKLKQMVSGLNIKENKLEEICERLRNAPDAMNAWHSILLELETLVRHIDSGDAIMPPTPLLDECGFILSEKQRIVTGLSISDWLSIRTMEVEFNPVFNYCTNKTTQELIPFGDASAGQQATALLLVLLNQQGAPLIIDQPEDDIDSKMIKDIVTQVWNAKKKRQLIFASHNANFVVNGDAELVMCCDYIKAGDQTGGKVKYSGAIDNKEVREEITSVTEGGPEAFKLRMEKYGF